MDYELLVGDCFETLKTLSDKSVECCITSPPYYNLRDYGNDLQIGLEDTVDDYISKLVSVFSEIKRILKDDGTLWVNIGDSYAANRTYQVPSTKGGKKHSLTQSMNGKGSKVPDDMKPKDMIGIPWKLAFALRDDGWWLRQEIIWHSPNAMPESVKDRCVSSHEKIFLLSKSQKYYFDYESIAEDGIGGEKRRKRDVWSVNSAAYKGIHGAVFPPRLIEPCVLAGCPVGGTIIDPFGGTGTVAGVAISHNRKAILCELNQEYADLVPDRIVKIQQEFQNKPEITEDDFFKFG